MKKVYYKGKIISLNKLQDITITLGNFEDSGISEASDDFLKYLNSLEYEIRKELKQEIYKTEDNKTTNLTNPIFNEIKQKINDCFMKEYQKDNYDAIDIIFEVITSKNGDLYGKELYTGLLFPLSNLNKIKYKIMRDKPKHAVKNVNNNEILFVKCDSDHYMNDKLYYISNYGCTVTATYYDKYASYIEKFTNYDINFKANPINIMIYNLMPIINSFENLDLCEAIVFNYKTANQNEIDEYLNRFKGVGKLFGKDKKFIREITKLYNKNVFNSIVEEKEKIKEVEKTKIEKDPMTLKLENIEYLLAIVKQKDIESYQRFLKEYNEIILSENKKLTLNPLTIENLSFLEGQIEIYLNYSKNNIDNILELLNSLKDEYLDNFLNSKEKITKLTIADIDKINELFLKTKSKYSIKDQQAILKSISSLYIMEIIEDKDIKASDLENSYFEDNLKYVMITIMSLIENGIIENNVFIDYETNLDLYSVFNIIRNIEFKKDKVKTKKF